MTKKKTKKMTKSTFAIIIMGIALVALLAFGGTFAYFTSTSSARVSKFTTAVVNLRTNGGSNINFAANKVESRETISDKGLQLVNHSNVKTIVAVEFQVTYNGKYYESRAVDHTGSDGADYYKATDDELLLMNLYGLTLEQAHAQKYMWEVAEDQIKTTRAINPVTETGEMAYIPGKDNGAGGVEANTGVGLESNRLSADEVTEAFFSYSKQPLPDKTEADRYTGLVTGTGSADVGLNIENAPYGGVTSKEDTVNYQWVQGTGIYSNIYLLNTKGTHGQQTGGDYGFVLPESRPSERYVQDAAGSADGTPTDSNVVGGGDRWVSDGNSKYDFFPNDQNVTFKIDRNFAEYWVDSSNNGSQEEADEPYKYAYITDDANMKLPTALKQRFLLWADADVIFSVRAYQIQVEHVHTFGEMEISEKDPYKITAEEDNVGIVWEAIVNLVGGNDPTPGYYGVNGAWGTDPKTYPAA